MIEQARLWWADAWTWQAKLTWSQCLLVILLLFIIAVMAMCWDMDEEFGHERKQTKDTDEERKLQ